MTENKSRKTSNGKSKKQRWKLSDTIIVALISAIVTITVTLINLSSTKTTNTQISSPTFTSTNSSFASTDKSTPTKPCDAINIPMKLVPKGEFTMGEITAKSNNGNSDELPHQVYLNDFFIDICEVTNALYKICVEERGCALPLNTSKYNDPKYAEHPVVYLDWNMAKAYCESRGARLPTEAEWEKAARGKDGYTYPWGDTIDSTYANYNNPDSGDTTAVGSYPKGISPYGAYDMAGNVSEWVADWYDANYYKSSPQSNPAGPLSGSVHVIRGGSWYGDAFNLRSANRNWYNKKWELFNVGFRCARDFSP